MESLGSTAFRGPKHLPDLTLFDFTFLLVSNVSNCYLGKNLVVRLDFYNSEWLFCWKSRLHQNLGGYKIKESTVKAEKNWTFFRYVHYILRYTKLFQSNIVWRKKKFNPTNLVGSNFALLSILTLKHQRTEI